MKKLVLVIGLCALGAMVFLPAVTSAQSYKSQLIREINQEGALDRKAIKDLDRDTSTLKSQVKNIIDDVKDALK